MTFYVEFPCHHAINFGGYRSFKRRGISFFICHMTICDNVIKGHLAFLVVVLTYAHHPTKFGGRKSCGKEDKSILILNYHCGNGQSVSLVDTYQKYFWREKRNATNECILISLTQSRRDDNAI